MTADPLGPHIEAGALPLSIIIANYNGRDLLAGCLKSIYANPPTCSFVSTLERFCTGTPEEFCATWHQEKGPLGAPSLDAAA